MTSPDANHRGNRPGFALEATILLLVLFGAIVGASVAAAGAFARTSGIDARAARANYAAEGGADQIMAQLDAAMQDGAISPGEVAALQPPVMDGYIFDQATTFDGTPEYRTITRGAFAGLYAVEQPMQVRVSARDSSNNQAAVELGIIAQSIPIFQFGVFYNRDLEIHPGPPMDFVGWVHTNGNLYLSSNNATFRSRVSTADSVFWQRKDENSRLNGIRIADQSGTLRLLNFDSRDPAAQGANFVNLSNVRFGGRLQAAVSGVRPLRLPLPSNMDAIELIRPARVSDSPDIAAVRMANKADLRIVVDLAAIAPAPTTFCAQAQFFRSAGRTPMPASVCQDVFQFRPNQFVDNRENTQVDVLDIDIEELADWTDDDVNNRQVSILYVEFRNSASADPLRNYPAIRLWDGARLPNPPAGSNGGLTIATHAAAYVRGNYNSDPLAWRPAALLADAITYLSNGWNDGNSFNPPRNRAVPGSTPMTVNLATVAGNSETPADWMRAGGTQRYGGGLENFPRFLENWSGIAFNFTGSLVSLYASQQSTGFWGRFNVGGDYYSPPARNWSFDIRFRDPNNLPPGTPLLGSTLQIAFRSIF